MKQKQPGPKNRKERTEFTKPVKIERLDMTPESSAMVHYLLDARSDPAGIDGPRLPDKNLTEQRREALNRLIEGAFG